MASRSPLDAPHLRQIDDCLSAGEVARATELLARLDGSEPQAATTYLATRLLYVRDRLDPRSVAERLSELLLLDPNFPEARALLRKANAGVVGSKSVHPTEPADNGEPRRVLLPGPPPLPTDGGALRIMVDTRQAAHAPLRRQPAGGERAVDGRYSLRAPKRSTAPPPSPSLGGEAPPEPLQAPELEQLEPAATHHPGDALARMTTSGPRSSRPPSLRPLPPPEQAHELWSDVELVAFGGDRVPALDDFTNRARAQLSHLPQTTPAHEFEQLGILCAELLNRASVTRHFAPFDLSLYSLSRLEAAIATLCGMRVWPEPHSAVSLLLGAYVGEALRRAHHAQWIGMPSAPHHARLRAGSYTWQPFSCVGHWLHAGGCSSLVGELQAGLALPGSVAWRSFRPIKIAPRALWQGELDAAGVDVVARAVRCSVLSRACELLYSRALDGSLDSLDGFEQLLLTIVASARPLTGREPWLQRVALLAGAYLGQTIANRISARWVVSDPAGLGSQPRLLLELDNGRRITPVEHVLSRAVSQHPLDLELFANIALQRTA